MRAALRPQITTPDDPVLEVDNLKMDIARRLVTVGDTQISLTPTEYDILRLHLQNVGKVMTHRHLLRQVWGVAYESEMHILRVNISCPDQLRSAIYQDARKPSLLI